jgi:hypothetical protein
MANLLAGAHRQVALKSNRRQTGAKRSMSRLAATGGMKRLWQSLGVFAQLLVNLRRHDLRAARTWVRTMYSGIPRPLGWSRFLIWALRRSLVEIHRALRRVQIARPVSRTPIWLDEPNPWFNHPWGADPLAELPGSARVVVIGSGFTGGALACHGARRAPGSNRASPVRLELNPAANSSLPMRRGSRSKRALQTGCTLLQMKLNADAACACGTARRSLRPPRRFIRRAAW